MYMYVCVLPLLYALNVVQVIQTQLFTVKHSKLLQLLAIIRLHIIAIICLQLL